MTPLPTAQEVTVLDGRPLLVGAITHTAKVPLHVFGHMEILNFHVTELGGYDLVLGIRWLQKHDVGIDFKKDYLSFPPSCQDHVAVAHSPQPPSQPDSRINAAPRPSTPPRQVTPHSPKHHCPLAPSRPTLHVHSHCPTAPFINPYPPRTLTSRSVTTYCTEGHRKPTPRPLSTSKNDSHPDHDQ